MALMLDEEMDENVTTIKVIGVGGGGGVINYMDLVRDALDYRRWFEFQMYYRRGAETIYKK